MFVFLQIHVCQTSAQRICRSNTFFLKSWNQWDPPLHLPTEKFQLMPWRFLTVCSKKGKNCLIRFFFRHTVFVLNNVFFGINIINIFLSILGADDIGLSGPFSLRVNRKWIKWHGTSTAVLRAVGFKGTWHRKKWVQTSRRVGSIGKRTWHSTWG